jgi:site-specific recombinase XerD
MPPQSAPETPQNPPQDGARHPDIATVKTLRSRKSTGKDKAPWVPPRGIRYVHRPERPSPFLLVWTENRQERKRSFKDEKAREVAARALAEKREKHGASILNFDPKRWRVFEEFTRIVGEDTDPLRVALEWKQARGIGANAAPSMTVAKAVEKYLALRRQEGGVDKAYLSHVKLHLEKSFAAMLGDVQLHELTADQIRQWLGSLKGRVRKGSTGALGIEARRHYYRSASTFLSRCVSEQWLERNPCDIVATPQPTEEELAASEIIKLMPVGDVEKLFRANRDQRCVGRLALEAFGGVRYTTAGLMQKEHIDFERKALAMPGHIHKSRKRKFRQGHPDCLWAWLKHAPESCWTEMTERDYYNEKREAFIRANVKNPHNGLRHSFASYLLAHTKDLPRVSYLMQHAKTTMTEKYEGRASQEDAARYLAITPESTKLKGAN